MNTKLYSNDILNFRGQARLYAKMYLQRDLKKKLGNLGKTLQDETNIQGVKNENYFFNNLSDSVENIVNPNTQGTLNEGEINFDNIGDDAKSRRSNMLSAMGGDYYDYYYNEGVKYKEGVSKGSETSKRFYDEDESNTEDLKAFKELENKNIELERRYNAKVGEIESRKEDIKQKTEQKQKQKEKELIEKEETREAAKIERSKEEPKEVKRERRFKETQQAIKDLKFETINKSDKYSGGDNSRNKDIIFGYLDKYIQPLWTEATGTNTPIQSVINNYLGEDIGDLSQEQTEQINNLKTNKVNNFLNQLTFGDIQQNLNNFTNKKPIQNFTGLTQEETRQQFGEWFGNSIKNIGLKEQKTGLDGHIQNEIKLVLNQIGITKQKGYNTIENMYKQNTAKINESKEIYDRLNSAYASYFPQTFNQYENFNLEGKKPMFPSTREMVEGKKEALFGFENNDTAFINKYNLPVIFGKEANPLIYEPRYAQRQVKKKNINTYGNPSKNLVSYDFVGVGATDNTHIYGHERETDKGEVKKIKNLDVINLANPTYNPMPRETQDKDSNENFNIGEIMNRQLINDSKSLVGSVFEVSSNFQKEPPRNLTDEANIKGRSFSSYAGRKEEKGNVLQQTNIYRQATIRSGKEINPRIVDFGDGRRIIGRDLDLTLKRKIPFPN